MNVMPPLLNGKIGGLRVGWTGEARSMHEERDVLGRYEEFGAEHWR